MAATASTELQAPKARWVDPNQAQIDAFWLTPLAPTLLDAGCNTTAISGLHAGPGIHTVVDNVNWCAKDRLRLYNSVRRACDTDAETHRWMANFAAGLSYNQRMHAMKRMARELAA